MYARVLSAQADVSDLDQLVEILNEELLPLAAEQSGNLGFYGLADYSTGRMMTITYWATPQDLQESESSGYLHQQLARASQHLEGPITRETFVVVTRRDPV